LVTLGHRLAQVPELGGYAFSPDGRHLARLARRGGDLAVEALAPGAAGGPELIHAGDPLLSFGTELWVPSADHIWIRSGWPGCFLEPGRSLAVNISEPGLSSSGFLVDIAAGSHHRRFHISDHSADVLVGCDPASGLLWVSTDYPGYRRVGVADLGGGGKVRFV